MTRPTPMLDAAIRAAYDASPEYDCGEAIDGFQVVPGGKLRWEQWYEADPDLAEDFARRVTAGLRAALPWTPPEEVIEAMAKAHFESVHRHARERSAVERLAPPMQWEELAEISVSDYRDSALTAYRAHPLMSELWPEEER